ncbi:phage tail tape measure protein [Frigoribacterium sp. UYMn621]|uniref:phage tail tape measure protein n=1 Tax=Frigoribacterium sp. UYMn621 TaxID=3156343 RepID=UPI0033950B5F
MPESLSDKARIEIELVTNFEAGLASVRNAQKEINDFSSTNSGLSKGFKESAKASDEMVRGLDRVTSSSGKGKKASDEQTTSLISQRYALYDVATTYGVVGSAMLAVSGYALKVDASFESAFITVARTTDKSVTQLGGLKKELVDLSTQIPVSFDEIAKIATLGNQLGIPEAAVSSFTKTVAEFSTVTGIAVEETALSLGTIGQLLHVDPTNYQALGSSIALVGRNSVATEPQILAVSKEIAAAAVSAGFTAEQTVGLAGALASLKVAPEKARGSLQLFFGDLNKAVAAGGAKLENFSTITGIAADKITNLVRSGQGETVFRAFLGGLKTGDTVAQTVALDNLGLSQLRASDTFKRLSQSTDVYDATQRDAAKGYKENAELTRQYDETVATLQNRLKTFVNSLNALIEAFTSGAVPGLAGVVKGLTDVVNGLRDLSSNGAVKFGVVFGLVLVALVGGMFALRGASALATASTYALTTAQVSLAGSSTGATAGIGGLLRALFGTISASGPAAAGLATVGGAAKGAAVGVEALGPAGATADGGLTAASVGADRLTIALRAVAKATIILAVISVIVGFLTDFNGSMITTIDVILALDDAIISLSNGFKGAIGWITDTSNFLLRLGGAALSILAPFQAAQDAIAGVVNGGITNNNTNQGAANDFFNNEILGAKKRKQDLKDYKADLEKARDAQNALKTETSKYGGDAPPDAGGGTTNGIDKIQKSAGQAKNTVRTLIDYAGELTSVFDRAYSIRFSADTGLDAITSGWLKVKQNLASANTEIAKYQATMQTLTADRAVKEYWLSVATNYNDALRAGVLRGELSDIDQKLQQNSTDLTGAQDKNSKVLTGNTEAAIANRAEILGLIKNYQGYIGNLASSGASAATLSAKTTQLKSDFLAQATALGYNTGELGQYAAAFDDVKVAIDNVPRDITVTANTNPALQALNEFIAKAQSAASTGINIPIRTTGGADQGSRDALFTQWATQVQNQYHMALAQSASGWAEVRKQWDKGTYGSFATGGYTGDGGKYDVAGIAHKGEYIFTQEQTSRIGVDRLEAIAFGHAPAPTPAPSAPSSASASHPLELSQYDRQLLVDIRNRVGITLSGTAIQQANGLGNVNTTKRGAA